MTIKCTKCDCLIAEVNGKVKKGATISGVCYACKNKDLHDGGDVVDFLKGLFK
jgi:phage FluMu protein Com